MGPLLFNPLVACSGHARPTIFKTSSACLPDCWPTFPAIPYEPSLRNTCLPAQVTVLRLHPAGDTPIPPDRHRSTHPAARDARLIAWKAARYCQGSHSSASEPCAYHCTAGYKPSFLPDLVAGPCLHLMSSGTSIPARTHPTAATCPGSTASSPRCCSFHAIKVISGVPADAHVSSPSAMAAMPAPGCSRCASRRPKARPSGCATASTRARHRIAMLPTIGCPRCGRDAWPASDPAAPAQPLRCRSQAEGDMPNQRWKARRNAVAS